MIWAKVQSPTGTPVASISFQGLCFKAIKQEEHLVKPPWSLLLLHRGISHCNFLTFKNVCVCVFMVMLLFSHSVMSKSATPWTAAHQPPLSSTIFQSLLKFMSIELNQ